MHQIHVGRRALFQRVGPLLLVPFLPAGLLGGDCSAQDVEEIIMGILKIAGEIIKLYNSVSGSQEVEYTGQSGQAIKMHVELYEGSGVKQSSAKMVDGRVDVHELVGGTQQLPFDGLKGKAAGTHFAVATIAGQDQLSSDFVIEG